MLAGVLIPTFIGSSLEYKTLTPLIPLFFSSFLITFASGHTLVLLISPISNLVGSSLLPVHMEEITGVPASFAWTIKSSLAVTLSMASAT